MSETHISASFFIQILKKQKFNYVSIRKQYVSQKIPKCVKMCEMPDFIYSNTIQSRVNRADLLRNLVRPI